MSINAIGTNVPIEVAKGGIGVSTLTQYGVLYGNNANPVQATSVGTAGQVLTSNGAGVAPTFQTPGVVPGGGALVFIQTQDALSSASLIFNTGITTDYPNLQFLVNNILSDTIGDTFIIEYSDDGGSSFRGLRNGSAIWIDSTVTSTVTWNNISTTLSYNPLSSNLMPTSGDGLSGSYWYYNATLNTRYKTMEGQWSMIDTTSNLAIGLCSSTLIASGADIVINALRFRMLLGNILSGSISLYGWRNS